MNGEISRREDEPLDLSIELEVDRWNGAEQPRVVVRELYPLQTAESPAEVRPCGEDCPAPDEEWWKRLAHEMERVESGWPGPLLDVRAPEGERRELVDRRGGAAVASLAELISSGESVLAICADAGRRAKLASSAADPRRFGASLPRIACCRCGSSGLEATLGDSGDPEEDSLVLADWAAIARVPDAPRRFRHVVVIDPPPSEALEGLAWSGSGYVHLAWGPRELEFAERLLGRDWELRGPIGEIWRALRDAGGEAEAAPLRSLLEGQSEYPRTAEVAARSLRVLCELGLCEWLFDRGAGAARVLSSERTDLGRSRAYMACIARHQEAIRFLRSRAQA
jgi:hypothetical protein